MKKIIALAVAVIGIASVPSFAAPAKHHMMAGSKMYECQKCHMKVNAATAKKDHFKDPMDGGKLVPMKSAMSGKHMMGSKMKPMSGSHM